MSCLTSLPRPRKDGIVYDLVWDRSGHSIWIGNAIYRYSFDPNGFKGGTLFREEDSRVRHLLSFGVFTRIDGRFEIKREEHSEGGLVHAIVVDRIDGTPLADLTHTSFQSPGSGA